MLSYTTKFYLNSFLSSTLKCFFLSSASYYLTQIKVHAHMFLYFLPFFCVVLCVFHTGNRPKKLSLEL